jgi:uncharacterized protein
MEQTRVARVVLDVLKPHEPPLPEFALYLRELTGIRRAEISVEEIDDKTESLVVILTGNIHYEDLRTHLAVKGAAIHSVDGVTVVAS